MARHWSTTDPFEIAAVALIADATHLWELFGLAPAGPEPLEQPMLRLVNRVRNRIGMYRPVTETHSGQQILRSIRALAMTPQRTTVHIAL